MRSLIRQSGSRTLHLAYWPQFSASVEQAVTVSGPSIAWMMSATEIALAAPGQAVSAACALVRRQQAAPRQPLQHLGHQLDGNVVLLGDLARARRRRVGPRREVFHRHQRVVGFFGESEHSSLTTCPDCSFAASDIRSFVHARFPHDVDFRVGDAGDRLRPCCRPRPAATAPPDSPGAVSVMRDRRRHRRRRRHVVNQPELQMFTGISGSNTVEIASMIAGFNAVGFLRVGSELASSVVSRHRRGRRRDHRQRLHVIQSTCVCFALQRRLQRVPRQAGALHADRKLAHTGEHRQLAEILDRLVRRRRDHVWNCSNSARASLDRAALDRIGHQRRRRLRNRATRPWNATSVITSPSTCTYRFSRSPQSGL